MIECSALVTVFSLRSLPICLHFRSLRFLPFLTSLAPGSPSSSWLLRPLSSSSLSVISKILQLQRSRNIFVLNSEIKIERDHQKKKILWMPLVWVGRWWEPNVDFFISKADAKQNSDGKRLTESKSMAFMTAITSRSSKKIVAIRHKIHISDTNEAACVGVEGDYQSSQVNAQNSFQIHKILHAQHGMALTTFPRQTTLAST